MISIIVSSYKEDLFNEFSKSVENTIGAPYEILRIINHNQYSIGEAYNLGAQKSKYNILCFVHEDVIFISKDWGKRLMELYGQRSDIGIIGVAGCIKKSFLPTGWGTGIPRHDRINLIQGYESSVLFQTSRTGVDSFDVVKVLDGVFLSTPKKIWEEFKFDESLKGFHLYDIDFSLRITSQYQGIVSYDIQLIHLSEGGYNTDWLDATLVYHARKDKQTLFDFSRNDISGIRRSWYRFLLNKNIEKSFRKKYLKQMGVDILSFCYAFAFYNPTIGKPLLKIFVIFTSSIDGMLTGYKKSCRL